MKALIIVDVQNDFCLGGALAVRDGDKVVPVINELQKQFDLVVATKDWHSADHSSFAIWNPHCVQGTRGAEFVEGLETERIARTFLKGVEREVDSYSGFFDNDHVRSTELDEYLRERGVTEVAVVGLATDYCVKFTVLDAIKEGFTTTVYTDACRGVEVQSGDTERALEEMRAAGAHVTQSGVSVAASVN